MTNAERLQANNSALRECIGIAEDLPNVGDGSGGSCDYSSEDDLITGDSKVYRNDRVTSVWEYSFYMHSALEEINLPNVTKVGGYAFYKSVNLKSVNLPSLITLEIQALRMCTSLIAVNFPNLTGTLSTYILDGCTNLQRADFTNVDALASNSMNGCSALDTLILRRQDKIVSMQGVYAIRGTLIASGTGYIYVPKLLIETYKSATNWSTYASQFRAIEDYPNITGGIS